MSHREHTLGYAWAYMCRQYVFCYSLWVPLGTLWSLNNVRAWEGARQQVGDVVVAGGGASDSETAAAKKTREFFEPATRDLEAFTWSTKVKNYRRLAVELGCAPEGSLAFADHEDVVSLDLSSEGYSSSYGSDASDGSSVDDGNMSPKTPESHAAS
jgi:hypothetical protein